MARLGLVVAGLPSTWGVCGGYTEGRSRGRIGWGRWEGRSGGRVPTGVSSPFALVSLIQSAVGLRDECHELPSLVRLRKMAVAVETACQPESYVLPKLATCDMSHGEQSMI